MESRIMVTLSRVGLQACPSWPAGCEPVKLAEAGSYRIRVGPYRVIYVVDDDAQVVVIAWVARRREDTYRGL